MPNAPPQARPDQAATIEQPSATMEQLARAHLRRDRRPPVAERELRDRHDRVGPGARQVDDAGLDQRRRHVGPVAAGVHADGAADRPRHPDRPFEAGEPGGRRLASHGATAGPELLALEAARRRVLLPLVDGGPRPPLDVARAMGPVTAPNGTRALRRWSLPARTFTVASSPLP